MEVPGCPLSLRNHLRIILMDITLWIIMHWDNSGLVVHADSPPPLLCIRYGFLMCIFLHYY